VGVLAASALAARAFGNARLIASMPPTPIERLDPGLHEIKGNLSGEGTVFAPVSERPCLWFRLVLEQRRRNRWENVVDLKESARCVLGDGTGTAAVDLMEAEVVVVAAPRVRTGIYSVPSKELDELLQRIGGAETPPAGPFVRYREEVLLDGDVLYAVGTARSGDAGWTLVGEDGPYVVSDRDEAEVVRHQRRAGRRWAAVGMASLLALGWGLIQIGPSLLGS
jgi:hypothetical protein